MDSNIGQDASPIRDIDLDSNYTEVQDLEIHDPDIYKYKSMHLNIHSLPAKYDELKLLLHSLQEKRIKLDFILLCESYLRHENSNLYHINGYNFVSSSHRNKSGGGVCIYIRENIQFKIRDDIALFDEGKFESIFIETVSNKYPPVIVGEIYRVPNTNYKESCEKYDKILQAIGNKNTIIGTDQNIDFLKMNSPHASELLNTYLAHSMIPVINRATRLTYSTATLIDNIILKYQPAMKVSSDILISDISDHFPIICLVGYPNTKLKHSNKCLDFTYRPMKQENIDSLNNALHDINWSFLNTMDTTEAFRAFVIRLQDLIDIYMPLRRTQIPANHVIRDPWMTRGLINSSVNCIRLYRNCMRKSRDDIFYNEYIIYKNMYNKIKKVAKVQYYERLFSQYRHDIRCTWKTLNAIIGKTNDKTSISKMFTVGNTTVTDSRTISNKFCEYFSQVGQKYADRIPDSQESPLDYLKKKRSRNCKSLYMGPTDSEEIKAMLGSMKSKKSAGNDDLNSQLLKAIAGNITIPIALLINKSLVSGIVPDSLKIAKVIPVYKGKAKDDFSNYRPISLLPVVSKLLEKVVHKYLYHFINKSKLF